MTILYTDTVMNLAREILAQAGDPYTPEQQAEIPSILAAKARYFWAVDLNDWDAMKDVFVEEGFETFWSGQLGNTDREKQVAQNKVICDIKQMVPLHFGHNQIVRFLDDRHVQLLTRMNDYHTYRDNGDNYAGFGMYVDDLVKCGDNRWRIKTLRLDYGVLLGQLRTQG